MCAILSFPQIQQREDVQQHKQFGGIKKKWHKISKYYLTSSKESVLQFRRCKRCGFIPWVGKIPLRRAWQPTPVFLPEKSHGQKSLAGCSPWGCKESEMTVLLSVHAYTRTHAHTHTHRVICAMKAKKKSV